MFNGGVPDQLHQFIASSRPNSVAALLPLSTTTTTNTTTTTTTPFSSSNSSIDHIIHANYTTTITPNHAHESHHHHHHNPFHHHQLLPPLHHPNNFLHPMLHHVQHPKLINHHLHKQIDEQATASAASGPNNLVSHVDLEMMQTHTPIPELIPTVDHHHHHQLHLQQPWSEDEVLALKLAELGFKRSAEKCKEKFEEESQYFTTTNHNSNCSKSYSRLCNQLSELEELYHGQNNQGGHHQNHNHQNQNHHNGTTAGDEKDHQSVEENPSDELEVMKRNGNNRQGLELEELEISDSTRNETVLLLGGNSKEYYSDEMTEKVVVSAVGGVEISKSGINNNNENNNNKKKKKKRKRSSSLQQHDDDGDGDDDGDNDDDDDDGDDEKNHSSNKMMKFDMFKGFCEEIVKKMMAQQEEMHNKLLEDMVKRDEEKVAIEEAWKKQEMDRMNKELEIMAHEQALAGDRQASIIDFLNKVTQLTKLDNNNISNNNNKDNVVSLTSSSSSSLNIPPPPPSNPNPTITHLEKNQTNHHHPHYDDKKPSSSSSNKDIVVVLSSSTATTPTNKPVATSSAIKTVQNPISINDKEDLGKRWPRDEVLALINLRCNLYSTVTTATATGESSSTSDHHHHHHHHNHKAPLWERISQGMLELGYKRSAKRCKEKWENINKYFRKTKDVNKKRSVDSRTCPYFHQLSSLYNKGSSSTTSTTLVSTSFQQAQNNNNINDNNNHDHRQDDHIIITMNNNGDHHSPITTTTTTPADHHHHHNHGEMSSLSDNNNIIIRDDHHQEEEEAVVVVASTAFDFEF
ncbi:hypothetical protein F8388_002760 [Cannabis sativa]|uniref:Myb/SANT-like DNA-binding domain-containing protein n=1 Tax=Cannabis sativa TaxID=3483 RepID=A0A7J6F816_CANSA|nr:hypothetical protein F8388_002760 [Cannabis sativa]